MKNDQPLSKTEEILLIINSFIASAFLGGATLAWLVKIQFPVRMPIAIVLMLVPLFPVLKLLRRGIDPPLTYRRQAVATAVCAVIAEGIELIGHHFVNGWFP